MYANWLELEEGGGHEEAPPWYIMKGKGGNTREPIPEIETVRNVQQFGTIKNYWNDCPKGKACTFGSDCLYVHYMKVGSRVDYKKFYNRKAVETWCMAMVKRQESEASNPELRQQYREYINDHGCRFFVIGSCNRKRCEFAHTATLQNHTPSDKVWLRWMQPEEFGYSVGQPFSQSTEKPWLEDIDRTWRERSLQTLAHAMYLKAHFPTEMEDFDVEKFFEQVTVQSKESPRGATMSRGYPPAEGSGEGARPPTKEQLTVDEELTEAQQLAKDMSQTGLEKLSVAIKVSELTVKSLQQDAKIDELTGRIAEKRLAEEAE
jgi:hypothetical protein